MNSLAPLLLLWLASQKQSGTIVPPTMLWPTTASPPPPIKAFSAKPTTSDKAAPALKPSVQKPLTAEANKAKPAAKRSVKATLISRGAPSRNASVAELQAIVNARGGKLKRDGLYGPATAAAWAKLANSKGLPPTISRVGPKVASVAMHTYEILKVPVIP